MNNTLHLYNRDRVQVAAHRGVAGVNIPCNTIPAFDIALHGGAAILEMDLLKSLDGEIFIFHTGKEPFQLDRHIDLTRMTAEEIRKGIHALYQDNECPDCGRIQPVSAGNWCHRCNHKFS